MDSASSLVDKKYSIFFQIIIAVVFAFLNLAVCHFFVDVIHAPLFMDMIFVYAASFFGLASGLVNAIVFSLAELFFVPNPANNLPYTICSITGVLILRFCLKKVNRPKWAALLLVSFASAIIISVEGGIIFTLLFSERSFLDFAPTVYLTCQLLLSDMSLYAASILSRIPVNLVDKTIAVFAGYGVFVATNRMVRRGCIDK